MTPEDISYYHDLAYYAIVSNDANMSIHANALKRHLKKRAELVSASRIAEVDRLIVDEARQIERWRSPSACPDSLAKLVENRFKRLS